MQRVRSGISWANGRNTSMSRRPQEVGDKVGKNTGREKEEGIWRQTVKSLVHKLENWGKNPSKC